MTHTPLPPLLVLTDRTQARRSLGDVVRAAVEGGARAIVLREKDLPRPERARLADDLRRVLARVDGLLIVASDPTIPADGVHLSATDPVSRRGIVGRSCHCAAELRAASDEGCDYATLSPIFTTASKPGYGPPLGTNALSGLPIPTYALGGITAENSVECVAAGARGVAAMGTVMRAERPERVVAELLAPLVGATS